MGSQRPRNSKERKCGFANKIKAGGKEMEIKIIKMKKDSVLEGLITRRINEVFFYIVDVYTFCKQERFSSQANSSRNKHPYFRSLFYSNVIAFHQTYPGVDFFSKYIFSFGSESNCERVQLNELGCIQFNVASPADSRAAETMSHFVEESFSPFYLWSSGGLFEGKRKFNNRSSRSAGSWEVLVGHKKLPRHVRDFETGKVGKKYMKQIWERRPHKWRFLFDDRV
ncbi:hypothetical protein TNCT_168301 [Trichonephila clavata]|uniref:Uncharacterized protein n=1 Tax=Trichonephila clavata TaxID=2740835 RepID=A0A8X6JNU1_TRICU|nr:hypothetical protein TNCT_168301 [Trichonephila clavata]